MSSGNTDGRTLEQQPPNIKLIVVPQLTKEGITPPNIVMAVPIIIDGVRPLSGSVASLNFSSEDAALTCFVAAGVLMLEGVFGRLRWRGLSRVEDMIKLGADNNKPRFN